MLPPILRPLLSSALTSWVDPGEGYSGSSQVLLGCRWGQGIPCSASKRPQDPQLLGAHHNLHPAHILTSELPPAQCMETAAIPPPPLHPMLCWEQRFRTPSGAPRRAPGTFRQCRGWVSSLPYNAPHPHPRVLPWRCVGSGGAPSFSQPRGPFFASGRPRWRGEGGGVDFRCGSCGPCPHGGNVRPQRGLRCALGGGGEVEVRPQGSLPRNAGIVNIIITIIIRIVILMVVAFPARFPRGAVPVDAHRGCGVWDCPTMGMPHNPMGVLRF